MATDVLAQPTLVLNRQWQPVHVASVARAVTLLCNEAARVVDPEDYRLMSWDDWIQLAPNEGEPCIRSARLKLKVPEVICLATFDRLPNTAVTFSRRNVAKRDHFICQYCGAQPGADSISAIPITSYRARTEARRTGPTAPPPAWTATPGKATARPSKRECASGAGRFGPNGSRSIQSRWCPSKAGPAS